MNTNDRYSLVRHFDAKGQTPRRDFPAYSLFDNETWKTVRTYTDAELTAILAALDADPTECTREAESATKWEVLLVNGEVVHVTAERHTVTIGSQLSTGPLIHRFDDGKLGDINATYAFEAVIGVRKL